MRITIEGNICALEVIAEQFSIEGSDEVFAVHQTMAGQIIDGGLPAFTACHVGTGFAIARGHTIDEAIENGRHVWLSKTPEEISSAISRAKENVFWRDNDPSGGLDVA
jgi:hypothetical protein